MKLARAAFLAARCSLRPSPAAAPSRPRRHAEGAGRHVHDGRRRRRRSRRATRARGHGQGVLARSHRGDERRVPGVREGRKVRTLSRRRGASLRSRPGGGLSRRRANPWSAFRSTTPRTTASFAASACRAKPSGSAPPAATTTAPSPGATTSPRPSLPATAANPAPKAPPPSPVGSHPSGAGPYGHQDLTGNVWEWTADLYDPFAYRRPGAAARHPGQLRRNPRDQNQLRKTKQQGFTGRNPIPTVANACCAAAPSTTTPPACAPPTASTTPKPGACSSPVFAARKTRRVSSWQLAVGSGPRVEHCPVRCAVPN